MFLWMKADRRMSLKDFVPSNWLEKPREGEKGSEERGKVERDHTF